MSPNPRDALRAWFLGPRAENAALMERLITESFRDHVFWRRNFRPEDGVTIQEVDRRQEGYEAANATLTQELMSLLAQLKRDVPFFSGRYQGHMVCEPTIAAQVGYFAAMLYNPNNVTREAGPVTTRLEFEVVEQLARMIGFDPATTWGHLTSGGTVANFEALWIARSLFYLPVAAAMAARAGAPEVSVQRPDGATVPLASMGLYELLNLRGPAALDAWDALRQAVPRTAWPDVIDRHTLAHAGYQEYTRRLARHWGDPLPDSVVLVAATAHYSWEKIVRALGIGAEQLCFVPVDRYCRIDPDALWERIEQLEFKPPRFLRDLLWRPAEMVIRGGPEALVYVPVLYFGSHRSEDAEIRLGRKTDWQEMPGGPTAGVGQRMLLVGDDAVPILSIGRLSFSQVDTASSSAG